MIKVLKKIFTKSLGSTATNLELTLQITEEELESYSTFLTIQRQVADIIAKELEPTIKNRLLEDKEFEKFINEVRLLAAKKFLE